MIIRAGFKTTCIPAGVAMAYITGDMSEADALDAIELLEISIRQIRRQIDASKSYQEEHHGE